VSHEAIVAEVERYYTGRLRQHGATPAGVDWNSEQSQVLRFEQLMKVVPGAERFSLLDYGCGYGALYQHLREQGRDFSYLGFDVSTEMAEQGRQLHGAAGARFVSDAAAVEPADFAVASGIFNVRLEVATEDWKAYVEETIDKLNALSTRGFAFNLLTGYADPEKMRPDLHYADPLALFDRCQRRYSRFVSLLHDYPLYEFTIVVRK
jgi:SAM-dependent methyltransferase